VTQIAAVEEAVAAADVEFVPRDEEDHRLTDKGAIDIFLELAVALALAIALVVAAAAGDLGTMIATDYHDATILGIETIEIAAIVE
jgi:hypothetical protein